MSKSNGDGVEEVAPARLSPRFGHEGTKSEGPKVGVGGEVIQNLVDDILWDSTDSNRIGFCGGGTPCL